MKKGILVTLISVFFCHHSVMPIFPKAPSLLKFLVSGMQFRSYRQNLHELELHERLMHLEQKNDECRIFLQRSHHVAQKARKKLTQTEYTTIILREETKTKLAGINQIMLKIQNELAKR